MYVLGLLLLFQHTVNSEVFYIFCMQNKSFVSSFAGKMSVFFIIIISIFNQQAHFNLIFFFFFFFSSVGLLFRNFFGSDK